MRDSFSPRHMQAGVAVNGISNNNNSSNRQQHHQNRPPFSPTNPKNLTNRTITDTNSADVDDPWKVNTINPRKFGTSKLAPPNPEGRSSTTLSRVSSVPNNTMHRPLSRGRLMEGPAATTTTAVATTTIGTTTTNIDIWDTTDHSTEWNTTTYMNDDSTWFGGGDVAFVNSKSKSNNNSGGLSSSFNWGRRTRSSNDAVGNSNSISPFNNIVTSDPWRLRNGSSADSGERSLYDDSGDKIHHHQHSNTNGSNPRMSSSSSSFGPTLGSSSRPISTTSSNRPTTMDVRKSQQQQVADGSLNRPIPIHDCAHDVMDEQERDVLQNAIQKQKVNDKNNTNYIHRSGQQPVAHGNNSQNNSVADDDVRDSDILQKATKRRQGLLANKKQQQQQQNKNSDGVVVTATTSGINSNLPIPFDTNLSKIEASSQLAVDAFVAVNDSMKQIPTPKQSKGIMGFFRGGGLGGGKRVETKKKPTVKAASSQLDSPMSRSSRQSETRHENVIVPSTFSIKKPSPINVWAPSSEKPKVSTRSKSPANVWTALSDNTDETDPIWNYTGDNKIATVVDTKPIVLQATTTTVSNENPMKPDIVFRNSSLLEQQGDIGSSETHDDGTTVSGVTNPSFFPEEKPIKKHFFRGKTRSLLAVSGEESFTVNSPVFTSGRTGTSGRIAPSPRDKIISTLPVLCDDDFSDPFFPNGTEDVTKEESGVSKAPDLEIDQVCVGTDNESEDKNHSALESKQKRNRRSNARKAAMVQSNKETVQQHVEVKIPPIVPTAQPVHVSNVVSHNGISDTMSRKVRERKSPTFSRRDRNTDATTVPLVADMETKSTFFVSPKTMVSMKIVELENKPTKPASTVNAKRGSPFRRGQLRHRETPTDVFASTQPKPPKVIQSSSTIPPIVGRSANKTTGEKSMVVLAKSSSEGTITGEPRAFVKAISSNDDLGLSNGKHLGRSGDLSLSSVGSDIQRLRSILRRSRIQGNGDNVRYIEPLESAFATYDEKQIKDPMQRAGLRLLSAAVVPIQSAIRRHLAFRSALTRMWAIVTIQAATRRWFVRYDDFRWATIKLQAMHRGGRERDQILLEHCCAIEIQRHVRGLIASWHVYDEINKIKLVQACARRKLAMERAMDRMVSIIQIQSIGRGFFVRLRQKRLIAAVTCVQAAWRAFSCRFTYQLDILDIIIAQSVWRKNLAKLTFARLQHEHRIRCAIKIQSQWRSYDCSMNYLHYIADVLITQSVVRRYIAIRHCKKIRNSNALVIQMTIRSFLARLVLKRIRSTILIQSAYRGFVCYADYMFTISDIVLTQSVARRWLKQKDYPQTLFDHKSKAVVTIQRHWRGFSQATDYYVMRLENKSAIAIQSAWRRFFHYSIFIVVIDSAIRIQSSCRGFMVREKLSSNNNAAVKIQCAYRVAIAKDQALRASTAQKLFKSSADIAVKERQAVTTIQRVIRGAQVRDAVGLYTRTRIFQSAWRGYLARKLYDRHLKARCIQSTWRRYIASSTFALYINVRGIQSLWRGYSARSSYNVYRSARSIQTAWRGYEKRSSYNLFQKVRLVQTVWRGYEKRSSYTIYRKSKSIQAIWRGYAARTSYLVFLQARMIQSAWRKHVASATLDKHRAARKIQGVWRGYVVRTTVSLYLLARSIQAVWRGFLVRCPYKEYIACRRIQSSWRRRMAEKSLLRHFKARRIQTWWRCKSQRANFEAHKANLAATRIQASWRCKSASSAYKRFLAARQIQTAWRGTSISRAYKHFMNVRLVQALWRGRVVRRAYRQLTSVKKIQAVWRGRTICIAYRHYVTARRIQTIWRGRSIRKAYMNYRGACRVQAMWRGRSIRKAYTKYRSACRVQAVWRGRSVRKAYTKYRSACRVQAVWRGRSIRKAYTKYRSACRVQAVWRGRLICRAYKEFLMARRIQTFWRYKALCIARSQYKRKRQARYTIFYSVCIIQALWRRKSLETAFQQHLAAVRIQTFWRAISAYNAYEFYRVDCLNRRIMFEASRTIQSYWRCKTLSCAYKSFKESRSARYAFNSSALRIQTSWRTASLHIAFTQYIAVRSIQANWRRKLIRSAYLQFLACRRIQANWRCKLIRTAYKRFITSIQIQDSSYKKLFANDLTQANDAERLQREMMEQKSAATRIAATWLRFSTCQRYWHVLGSVIEIQTIVRGWIARRQLKQLQESALAQLRTANAIKYKSLERSRNYRLQLNDKQQQTDRAARTVQRFFLMVKAEVDREIRAEKKRRKVKKKLKKKKESFDDKLLESIWRKTIKDDVMYFECLRKVNESIVDVPKHTTPKLLTKGSEDSRLSTSRGAMSLCGTAVGTPMSASGRLGVVPLSVNSFKFDADMHSKGASIRPSKSRLDSMSSREIDEDFLLEEAWIDSKINSAKERRGGGQRVIDPPYLLGASTPFQSRRPTKDGSSDRRPPRRAQAV